MKNDYIVKYVIKNYNVKILNIKIFDRNARILYLNKGTILYYYMLNIYCLQHDSQYIEKFCSEI